MEVFLKKFGIHVGKAKSQLTPSSQILLTEETKTSGMNRWLFLLSVFLSYTASASAQITSGYGSTRSIPEMINHLLGINVYNPYEILGITATFGVLWVSTYVIFKVGIKRIDEGLDNNNARNSGLQDALGVDDSNSRNVLAVLTLLIVLTTIGTGAFLDIIRGWQSLIVLAFLFSILAGLVFVVFGGVGGVIGATGASARIGYRGVEQVQKTLDEISDREDRIDEEEDEEEDDIDDGNEDDADDKARITAEELEQIVDMIDDTEEQLDEVIEELEEELDEEIESVRKLVELLGDEDE
jgi:hypothetical protein